MTTLTGRSPGNTYKDLLQVSNSNAGVDATLRSVSDGEGTDSALQISTTEAKVNGDLTVTGSVSLSTGLPVSSGGTGATTEANAAPSRPQPKVKINRGSSMAFTSEPRTVAHMEWRASPSARTPVAALIPSTSMGMLGSMIPA